VPTTFAVVRVIRSKDSNYSVGDLLLNAYGLVAEYSIVPSSHIIRKIDPTNGISLSDYLGSLGSFSTYRCLLSVNFVKLLVLAF
jgi:NADPH-dependent curcumin reductase CurA